MATLDLERNKNLYSSETYSENTKDWEDSASKFRAEAFFEALRTAGLARSVESILDVGCGSGGVLMALSRSFGKEVGSGATRYTGIDLSAKAVEVSRTLYPDASKYGIEIRQGTLDREPQGPLYTVVSLIHVLEHCPDMLEMLELCEGHGSYIYLNVPLEVNLFYAARRSVLRKQYLCYGHLHFFDEGFFVEWLKRNGFEIVATSFSSDYEVNKPGLGYKLIRIARRWAGRVFGPATANWLLGGYSLGVLVMSRSRSGACSS